MPVPSYTDQLALPAQVTDSNGRIILFIDEIHTVVGAGASEGSMDAGTSLNHILVTDELVIPRVGRHAIQLRAWRSSAIGAQHQKVSRLDQSAKYHPPSV